MSEKTDIERATAEGFLSHYNAENRSDYKVVEVRDVPDIQCIDSQGQQLNIEITLTEDRSGDIKAVLGRSDHKSPSALREHLKRVKDGKEDIRFSCYEDEVVPMAIERISAKMAKNYGSNVALVVRDTSGVNWDWDLGVEKIRNGLNLTTNPFDRGIWILTRSKDKLFRVV